MRPKIDEICRIYSLKEPEAEEVLRMYDSANGNLNAFCLMGRRVIIDKIGLYRFCPWIAHAKTVSQISPSNGTLFKIKV